MLPFSFLVSPHRISSPSISRLFRTLPPTAASALCHVCSPVDALASCIALSLYAQLVIQRHTQARQHIQSHLRSQPFTHAPTHPRTHAPTHPQEAQFTHFPAFLPCLCRCTCHARRAFASAAERHHRHDGVGRLLALRPLRGRIRLCLWAGARRT
eukprot:6199572-Pleurochrysis_carterae.AAC.1